MKKCDYCGEELYDSAVRCKHYENSTSGERISKRKLKMKICMILMSFMFLYGCSNLGGVMENDSRKITLSTGNKFANALVDNRYSEAFSLLSAELQKSWSPEKLESSYKEMISYGGEPAIVDGHTEFMGNWPDKKTHDIGWVYVSISGKTFGEAVTLIVTSEMGEPKIRHIEWGRP